MNLTLATAVPRATISFPWNIGGVLYLIYLLLEDPCTVGAALRGPALGRFSKYRVGDSRIIWEIQDKQLVVWVVRIGHR